MNQQPLNTNFSATTSTTAKTVTARQSSSSVQGIEDRMRLTNGATHLWLQKTKDKPGFRNRVERQAAGDSSKSNGHKLPSYLLLWHKNALMPLAKNGLGLEAGIEIGFLWWQMT
jgi:hypothetical protein